MFLLELQCAWLFNRCWRVKMPFGRDIVCYFEPCPGNTVSFTLEAKLDLSKHLIQVHLEILSRSVKNMASCLLTKYITWSKSSQSLHTWESWNCCMCTWLPFLICQVCSQVWCRPYLKKNFGFFELRSFPWSPSEVKVGTFYPFTLKVGFKLTFTIVVSKNHSFKSTLRQSSKSACPKGVCLRVDRTILFWKCDSDG